MTHRIATEVAPDHVWFKSSYSAENGTACVEVAGLTRTGRVGIRDSKDPHGPALVVTPDTFAAFIAHARAGRYGG